MGQEKRTTARQTPQFRRSVADDSLSSHDMSSFSIKPCDHHLVDGRSYPSSENGPFPPIFGTRSPPPLAVGSAINGNYSLSSYGFPEGLHLHHTDNPLGTFLATKRVAKKLPGGLLYRLRNQDGLQTHGFCTARTSITSSKTARPFPT